MKTKKAKNVVCAAKLPDLRKITVTAKDIKDSTQRDPSYCAIAVAIRRQLKGYDVEDVRVSGSGIEAEVTISVPVKVPRPQMCIGGKLVPMPDDDECNTLEYDGNRSFKLYLNLPESADTFIEKFDADRYSVKPRTFAARPELAD